MRIYLDANFFLAAFEGSGALAEAAQRILRAAESRRGLLVTSELTLAEVLVGPFRARQESPRDDLTSSGPLSDRLRKWLSPGTLATLYAELISPESHIEVAAADRPVLILAAHWRAKTGVKLPDAIHLATAEQAGCTHVVSGDKRLRESPDYRFQRVDVAVAPLERFLRVMEEAS